MKPMTICVETYTMSYKKNDSGLLELINRVREPGLKKVTKCENMSEVNQILESVKLFNNKQEAIKNVKAKSQDWVQIQRQVVSK